MKQDKEHRTIIKKWGDYLKWKRKMMTVLLLVGCFFLFKPTEAVYATPEPDDNHVVITPATTDVDTLYQQYKDNSFELMTQELEQGSLTGVKEAIVNSSATLKNFTWSGVKGMGQFNAEMVKFLFSLDVVEPLRKPIQQLTSSIAGNMLGIAGTIGICFVALIMLVKFIGEQRFKQAIRVFLMAILIFMGLAICKDANSADSLFNQMFEVDKQIETAFVRINPVLGDHAVPNNDQATANERIKSAGELIASRVFYTNVYEPYLLMNYGHTNPDIIRQEAIDYQGTTYDRINILLDNDVINDDNVKLHDEVTKYEADELHNRTIMYFQNLSNTFYGLFYLIVNMIQTVVYFILCFLRLIVAVMQVFLLPLLPILLLVGLFMTGINIFTNYAKAFGMTIFMKAMAGFACIFFATFLSLGFQLSNAVDNPWQKILTILIYLLTPLGLYMFRKFLGSLVTGQVSLADAASFATHPFSTEKRMRQLAKERQKAQKEYRRQQKEKRKAALRRRKAEAEKHGKQELGLKPQPNQARENKRSVLRRELQPKPQHKVPSKVEKAKRTMRGLHEQSQKAEERVQQQFARQRQQKAFDRSNLRTAATLRAMNHGLQAAREKPSLTPKAPVVGNQLRPNHRRIGQPSKRSSQRQQRKSGQKDTKKNVASQKRTKGSSQADHSYGKSLKQRPATSKRSTSRSQHLVRDQKPMKPTVIPKSMSQARLRVPSGSSGSPLRRTAPVRLKMQGVNQVMTQNNEQTQSRNSETQTPMMSSPITRTGRKHQPAVKPVRGKSRGGVIRRPNKHTNKPKDPIRPQAPQQTNHQSKGMRKRHAK